jgi:hypothetical protein
MRDRVHSEARTPTVRACPWLATLLCVACASHHLPPEDMAKANLEAMREAVAVQISDAPRAARLNQAIDGIDASGVWRAGELGMLIALLLGVRLVSHTGGGSPWFYGGATSHQMRKEVARIESDSAKRELIDQTLDKMDKEVKRMQSERAKLEKDVAAALANHSASREEFQALAARADSINTSSREVLLDQRFALRDQVSEAQWRALFPAPVGHPAS